MLCALLPGVHPRRIVSVRGGKKWISIISAVYYESWKNMYFLNPAVSVIVGNPI
jgi:hypothetical protein